MRIEIFFWYILPSFLGFHASAFLRLNVSMKTPKEDVVKYNAAWRKYSFVIVNARIIDIKIEI